MKCHDKSRNMNIMTKSRNIERHDMKYRDFVTM